MQGNNLEKHMLTHRNEKEQEDVNADGIYDRELKMETLDAEFKRKMELGRKAKEIFEENHKFRLINKFKVLKMLLIQANICRIWLSEKWIWTSLKKPF